MNAYDKPKYYEVAYSYRRIPTEVSTLIQMAQKYSAIEVNSFLEIGSGNSPHMLPLLQRGYQYVGIELNPFMVEYAKNKTKPEHDVNIIEGDMRDFTLPEPVDFAFVMVSSLFLVNNQEYHGHFDSIARSLKPGGLYLLEYCVYFEAPGGYVEWDIERDGIKINANLVHKMNWHDQCLSECLTLNVDDNGTTSQCTEESRRRVVFPQEFRNFVDAREDFEFVGWWDGFNINNPIDIDKAEHVIQPVVVIRRI